jgi:transposase
VSIVNPAQIRDFARTKLGRNKTDQVDAEHIREYAELFKPRPWTPPSSAMRRLCELQTIRAGTVADLTEWKDRRGSGIMDDLALSLAETTIQHFTTQLEAVDQAIAETIDNDVELSPKRDLLVSINGVGEALAGIVLAELPGPDILGSSAAVAAYAGLNPQQRQSGISVNGPCGSPKLATPCSAPPCTCRLCRRCVTIQRSLLWSIGSRLRGASRESRL